MTTVFEASTTLPLWLSRLFATFTSHLLGGRFTCLFDAGFEAAASAGSCTTKSQCQQPQHLACNAASKGSHRSPHIPLPSPGQRIRLEFEPGVLRALH